MTPQPDILQQCHLDTIPAMQAAFEMGRAEYLSAQNKYRDNVLFGWPSQRTKPQNNLHLNGGGMKQLKHDAIELALSETGSITKAAKKLKVNRGVVYDHFRRKAALCVLSLFVLSFVSGAFAQRGTGSNPLAQGSGLQTQDSLLALAPAPAPVKQTILTWDNPAGASNRVAWGVVRYQWTNSVTVATNRFNITNGLCYAITSIVNGIESIPALWPSNRIGELWLTGMTTNFTQGTNIVRLAKFTNSPPGNMQFWGVANVTTGWE